MNSSNSESQELGTAVSEYRNLAEKHGPTSKKLSSVVDKYKTVPGFMAYVTMDMHIRSQSLIKRSIDKAFIFTLGLITGSAATCLLTLFIQSKLSQ